MKKTIVMTLLGLLVLLGTATVFAGSDTTGHCKLCPCPKYQQGPVRQGQCICGHSKGVHASVPR